MEAVRDCKSSGKTVAAWCQDNGISRPPCKELTLRQEAPLPAPVFAECSIPVASSTAVVILHLNCGTVEIQNGAEKAVIAGTLHALKNLC